MRTVAVGVLCALLGAVLAAVLMALHAQDLYLARYALAALVLVFAGLVWALHEPRPHGRG